MPVTIKSNLNSNFSINKTGKNLDEYDLNITSKTYKELIQQTFYSLFAEKIDSELKEDKEKKK